MEPLEKLITANRTSFDDAEPAAGHFERFESKMMAQHEVKQLHRQPFSLLRIAAIILLFLTTTLFVFDIAGNKLRNNAASASDESFLDTEMQNALQYYDTRTSDKMIEFKRLACCGEQQIRLTDMMEGELNALDANSQELKEELSKNPNNEEVQAALIRNHQMKEEVVDNVIRQLKTKQ